MYPCSHYIVIHTLTPLYMDSFFPSFPNSFIHLFTQQPFSDHLHYARHCIRCLEKKKSKQQNRNKTHPVTMGLGFPMDLMTQLEILFLWGFSHSVTLS